MTAAAPPTDVDLLARAREGDQTAFTELYTRPLAAARRVASSYRRAGDPDDLVNEALTRVLGAVQRGGGPDEAFRAYLFVTLRRTAAEQIARMHDEPVAEVPEPVEAEAQSPPLDPAERQLVVGAYESLPAQWQSVLWQTAVEGRRPREVAATLGISGNAASALGYRAREKLRQAYLQAHLQADPRPGCEPHRSRLGAYVRDGLSRRDRASTDAHLEDCDACRGLLAELVDMNSMLVRSLFPLFALATKAGALAAGGAAATTGGAGAVVRSLLSKARSNPATTAATAAAAAAAAVALSLSLIGDGSPPRELVVPADTEQAAPTEDEPAPEAPAPEPPPTVPTVVPVTTAPPAPAPPPTTTVPPTTTTTVPPPTTTTVPPPPTTTTTVPPVPPAPDPEPIVWFPDTRTLQVTLTNPGTVPTEFLVVNVRTTGQAALDGDPIGCDVVLEEPRTPACGVDRLPPRGTTVVEVPLAVERPGQKARVSLCAADRLGVDCDTPLGDRTSVDLIR